METKNDDDVYIQIHVYISDGLRIRLVHFIILCFQFLYGLDVSNCTIYSSTYISCDDEHLVVRTLPPHLFMKKCSLSTNTEWKKIIDQNKIEKRNTVQREELSVLIKAYTHIDGYVYVCECVTTALLLPLLLFVDNKTLPVRMMWNNANETRASKRRIMMRLDVYMTTCTYYREVIWTSIWHWGREQNNIDEKWQQSYDSQIVVNINEHRTAHRSCSCLVSFRKQILL